MGWYALYKWFKPFRLKPYTHWLYWYSRSVKTPEQRAKEKREGELALRRFGMLMGIMNSFTANSPYRFR